MPHEDDNVYDKVNILHFYCIFFCKLLTLPFPSAELTWHEGSSTFSSPNSPWGVEYESSVKHQSSCESKSPSPGSGFSVAAILETLNGHTVIPTSRTQWISFNDELNSSRPLNLLKEPTHIKAPSNSNPPVASFQLSSSNSTFDDQSDLQNDFTGNKKLPIEENDTGSFPSSASQPVDVSLTPVVAHLNNGMPNMICTNMLHSLCPERLKSLHQSEIVWIN